MVEWLPGYSDLVAYLGLGGGVCEGGGDHLGGQERVADDVEGEEAEEGLGQELGSLPPHVSKVENLQQTTIMTLINAY